MVAMKIASNIFILFEKKLPCLLLLDWLLEPPLFPQLHKIKLSRTFEFDLNADSVYSVLLFKTFY